MFKPYEAKTDRQFFVRTTSSLCTDQTDDLHICRDGFMSLSSLSCILVYPANLRKQHSNLNICPSKIKVNKMLTIINTVKPT
jgi:hypothetical protein